AILLALDAGEAWKVLRVLQHEGVRRARVEPDVEDVIDLLPRLVGELAQEALARARRVPGVGAFLFKGISNADVDARIVQDLNLAIALLAHEHGDRHAPGALARDHPVGLARDHAVDAVLARGRHPARRLNAGMRAGAQRIGRAGATSDRLVHRDEPLRRIA